MATGSAPAPTLVSKMLSLMKSLWSGERLSGGYVDSDDDRERLRQRMDDLLRDARALRALIEEASHPKSSKGEQKPSDSADTSSDSRAHRPPRG